MGGVVKGEGGLEGGGGLYKLKQTNWYKKNTYNTYIYNNKQTSLLKYLVFEVATV